jgi:uncharacterized protein YbbC (DUF1343 family)
MKNLKLFTLWISLFITLAQCSGKATSQKVQDPQTEIPTAQGVIGDQKKIVVGAEQLDLLLPLLQGRKVALIVNNTSLVGTAHLADTLITRGVSISKIFAPEHGFRGTADAGEHVKDGIDIKSGLPLVSLYGSNRKPTPEQLSDVETVIFDIQDVGVRFYTYISTLHYIMEACAENQKKLIILDRPNPNGSYIDGPVMELQLRSFLGMHTIPLVHGLTIGEFAQMLNGEGWLTNGEKCSLQIITLKNWTHADPYSLPAKPSPNLPNDQAIRLYPSLGTFEGTVISVGRGTQTPFQIIGHPDLTNMPFEFTPVSIEGMSKTPPYENKVCHGLDLRNIPFQPHFTLQFLIDMYNAFPDKDKFFNDTNFDRHLGSSVLRDQIRKGMSESEIKKTWEKDLVAFKEMRKKYLLYQ